MSRTIDLDTFLAELKAQGVSSRQHLAFVCVMCKCPQSMASMAKACPDATAADLESSIGFSCVGRWTGAGSPRAEPDGAPCNWTLGGLLNFADLYVVKSDGQTVPHFEIASPEQAQALEASL